ncbi:hypothetical protein [Mesorhizobium sp. KR1-2]|uniref:hypothetical protein n=1 Tax=Mesorhizobium sp. KR1-2 TaxID=3156609 RepID=UPI0032B32683
MPPLVSLTAGASYEVKFEIVNYVSGGLTPRLGASGGTDVLGTQRTANGIYTQTLVANGTSDQIKFSGGSFVGGLKSVSVKKITAAGEGGPITVFNGLTSPATAVAWADGGNYLVENIAFAGGGRSTTTYGWLQQGDGSCELINCRAKNVSLGLAAIDGRRIKTSNCLAKSCDQGFRAHYGMKMTFGNSAENFNRAMECDIGVFVSRNAIGHVDYMVVDDAISAGLWLDTGAPRVNLVGSDFRRCAVGVEAQSNSEWLNELDGSPTANNFNMGTPDACGIAYRHSGGAIETRLYGQQSQTEHRIGYDRTLITHTGTTTQTTLARVTGRTRSKKLRLRVWGNKIGAAGSKTLLVAVSNAGTSTNKQTIASGSLSTVAGAYMIEFEISPTSFAAQKQSSICWLDGANPLVNPASVRGASMTVDREIRIDATLANAADSLTTEGYDVFLMG